jgi:hypothetical protein
MQVLLSTVNDHIATCALFASDLPSNIIIPSPSPSLPRPATRLIRTHTLMRDPIVLHRPQKRAWITDFVEGVGPRRGGQFGFEIV